MNSRAAAAVTMVQRLYETGELSDLTVRTPTKDFHVHRDIVCELSPYFQEACERLPESGIITVDESEATMSLIFRHMYRFEVKFHLANFDWLVSAERISSALDLCNIKTFLNAMELRTAVDKYDIPDFDDEAWKTAQACIYYTPRLDELVAMASFSHGYDDGQSWDRRALRFITLVILTIESDAIMEHPKARAMLRSAGTDLNHLVDGCKDQWKSLGLERNRYKEWSLQAMMEFFAVWSDKLDLKVDHAMLGQSLRFLFLRQDFLGAALASK